MKDLVELYGVRCDNTDTDFPGGKFKGESTENADDGTPLQTNWCNQLWSFARGVLYKAGVSPNDTVDTVLESQVLDTLLNLAKSNEGTSHPESDRYSICSGLPENYFDWANPNGSYNHTGVLSTIRDACICWDTDENIPFVMVLETDGSIKRLDRSGGGSACWHYSGSIGATELTISYPETPDQIEAIACDGNLFFIAWSQDSGHHHVTAYSLEDIEGTHSWTRDTLIDKVGGSDDAIKLIVAQNGTSTKRLALQVQDGAGGSGSARTTAIINSTSGAIVGSGPGSYLSGYGDDANARCRPISDGSHLFWIGYQTIDATRKYYVMSASIADPSTSSYASKEITESGDYTTVDTWTHPKAIALVNDAILIISSDGTIKAWDPYEDTLLTIFGEIAAPQQPTLEGNQDVLVVDDGMNIWATSGHEDLGSVKNTVAFKIPKGPSAIIGGRITVLSLSPSSVVVRDDVPHESASEIGGRLLFDDRDLWFISRAGDVYRIVNPGAR